MGWAFWSPGTGAMTSTCHSLTTGEWGNDHRWVVHAKFSYWMPRSEGRPASVLSDPEVN